MAKKRPLCIICISLGLLMLIAYVYFFWAASKASASYESIVASDVVLSRGELSLTLDCTDSAQFFWRNEHNIVNHTLYLTVYHGPSLFRFRPWPVQVHIQDEALNNVHSVYLRDGSSARLVYIGLPDKRDTHTAKEGIT